MNTFTSARKSEKEIAIFGALKTHVENLQDMLGLEKGTLLRVSYPWMQGEECPLHDKPENVLGVYSYMPHAPSDVVTVRVHHDTELVINTLAHEMRHQWQAEMNLVERLEKGSLLIRGLRKIPKFKAFFSRHDYYTSWKECDARAFGAWYAKEGKGNGPRALFVNEMRRMYPHLRKKSFEDLRVIRASAVEEYEQTLEYNDFVIEM